MNRHISLKYSRLDTETTAIITGRIAQTLWHLNKAGNKGITALEMSNTWALRLADYVYSLRHEHSIVIRTDMEPHDGGKHARYVLLTPVEILEVKSTKNNWQ